MSITLSFAAIADAQELVCDLLESSFKLNKADALEAYKELSFHFTRLKENCWLVAETPYVDKVHRDSYYHYYSSKHSSCIRDSARVSVFEGEVKMEDFRDVAMKDHLKKNYRGFMILRPTEPFFMGRTVISPAALKDENLQICNTVFDATACGIKFKVRGFPHASQDTETMTCAETTLWAMMEYFSTRYAEYRPVLPSKIINTLNKVSVERQIPSRGLSIPQISYALREFGFGTRIYAREDFNEDFEKIISCYVESGIPVVIAVDNRDDKGNIGHAMICIGREKNHTHHFAAIPEIKFDTENKKLADAVAVKKLRLFDYDDIKKNFVFIDDNKPAYSKATLEKPCLSYWQDDWQKCKTKYVIVPLYKRIHLEAFEAKKFITNFLLIGPYPLQDDQEILLRVFLTSSRSYKDKLAHNISFSTDLKEKIIGSALPKFIWVGELTTKDLIQQNKAKGVVLLDATEANTELNKPLILAAFEGNVIETDTGLGELVRKPLPLTDFLNYENNLTEAY
jgi:hypothetical protein